MVVFTGVVRKINECRVLLVMALHIDGDVDGLRFQYVYSACCVTLIGIHVHV